MRVIIDLNHPAHVHVFKNLNWELKKRGHDVLVTASKKEISFELLKSYKIDFVDMGSYGNTMFQKILNIPVMSKKMIKIANDFKPDIMIGISNRISHVTLIKSIPSIVLYDTDPAKEQMILFKYFASNILTPDCFFHNLGKNHVRYNSYHEFAYLHPNRFKPNPQILREIGVNEGDKFFVIRFISWKASHDIGKKGLNYDQKKKLINYLKEKGKLFITSEKPLEKEFEEYRIKVDPTKIHDLLSFCSLYIGEGITMASEAAVLGTPAILINSLVMSYIDEEEKKYELIYRTTDFDKIMQLTSDLLSRNNLKDEWIKKRDLLIKDKIDLTDYLINYIENYPINKKK